MISERRRKKKAKNDIHTHTILSHLLIPLTIHVPDHSIALGEKLGFEGALHPQVEDLSTHAYKVLIGGKLMTSPTTFDVINPATGNVFAQAPDCSKELCDEAVSAAKDAFKTWQASTYDERKAVLDAITKATNDNKERLVKVLVLDQGKPLSGAEFEVGGVAPFMEGIAASAKVEDKVLKDDDNEKVLEVRVPLGVVAGICPWNYPLVLAGEYSHRYCICVSEYLILRNRKHTSPELNLTAFSLFFSIQRTDRSMESCRGCYDRQHNCH